MNTSPIRLMIMTLLAGTCGLVACGPVRQPVATVTTPLAVSSAPPPSEAAPTSAPALATATVLPATTLPTSSTQANSATQVPATSQPAEAVTLRVETVASGLEIPKALAFAPDGRLFVAERPGRVRIIRDGVLLPDPALTLQDVAVGGEHGLSGMTLAPDFASSRHVYLYYTYRADNGLRNRVVRYVEQDNTLFETAEAILDGIPAGAYHDGGFLAFGPDGKLYVTTGDARRGELAQDLASLAGKILRLNADGSVPADNPFPGSPVYSLGHRNPQGLAWQPDTGQLYATEHGEVGNDEVNLIVAGQNYGWPDAQGPEHPAPFRAPLVTYSPAVAPASAAFYAADLIPQWRGSLLFATLRGTHLHRLTFAQDDPARVATQERLYDGQLGRLRAVVQGPDGALYFTTSNREDSRPADPADDRVLRVVPV
jgi:aldose sugar dehydrogenase